MYCIFLLFVISEDNPKVRPQKDKNDDLSLFFSELGSAGPIKPADARGADEKLERDMISKTSLHK